MTAASNRRRFLHFTVALSSALVTLSAHAVDGKALICFTTSPSSDAVFTTMLNELKPLYQPDLGSHPVSVAGNGGLLAIAALKKAVPDGATVLICPSDVMTLGPDLRQMMDAPDHPVPVAAFGEMAFAFIVGPAVPASVVTMADYVAWVRRNPQSSNYGVAALGAGTHFVGAEIARKGDVQMKPVPYKGMTAEVGDLLAGNLPAAVVVVEIALDAAKTGRSRTLAVTSESRWPAAPDLPTLMELGLAESSVVESLGVFAPIGTPREKILELGRAVGTAVGTTTMRQALAQAALRPPSTTYENYAASLTEERNRWQTLIKRSGFKLDS